jgi:hypothetical protein
MSKVSTLLVSLFLGFFLLASTGALAAENARSQAESKRPGKAETSFAYVLAGCTLMTMGIMLGHIRQRPSSRTRSPRI